MEINSRPRVILIDSNEATRDVLASRLHAQGYTVEVAEDSAAGADLALSAPPAAVVADLWMRGVSGIQLCRLLKSEPATADVPVILQGDLDDPRSRFWAERAGAVAYVLKGRMGDLARALSRAIATSPAADGFFQQLGGGTVDIRDRIASHLDAALFESVILSEVRALSTAETFERLFDRLSQLTSRLISYRWLSVSLHTPPRAAIHHHPATERATLAEVQASPDLAFRSAPMLVQDEDATESADPHVIVVRPIVFGGVQVGSLGISVPESSRSDTESLISLVARELGAPLRMTTASEERRASAEFLERIYRTMPGALLVIDRDGVVRAVNEAAVGLLGHPQKRLLGMAAADLFGPGHAAAFDELHSRTVPLLRAESTCITADGTRIPVLVSATLLPGSDGTGTDPGIVCILLDIREQKRLEAELRQAQRLESVGRLAGGVAHEINTPVQFVGDSVHFVRDAVGDLTKLLGEYEQLRNDAERASLLPEATASIGRMREEIDAHYLLDNLPSALDRALHGLERVASIVKSMKQFAQADAVGATATDLNESVRNTLTLARSQYDAVADVELELGELPSVVCHAGEVNEAILGIVVNAAHAIGDIVKGTSNRGRITIRTRTDSGHVTVSVSDTGGGIPPEVAPHIFDPFFTTKELGKGTGQGLAVARAVLQKQGGTLTFETEVGHGSTFVIRLPVDTRVTSTASSTAA